jgi:hypothetical protein
MLAYTTFLPNNPYWGSYSTITYEALAATVGGTFTPQEAVEFVVDGLQRELGDNVIIKPCCEITWAWLRHAHNPALCVQTPYYLAFAVTNRTVKKGIYDITIELSDMVGLPGGVQYKLSVFSSPVGWTCDAVSGAITALSGPCLDTWGVLPGIAVGPVVTLRFHTKKAPIALGKEKGGFAVLINPSSGLVRPAFWFKVKCSDQDGLTICASPLYCIKKPSSVRCKSPSSVP